MAPAALLAPSSELQAAPPAPQAAARPPRLAAADAADNVVLWRARFRQSLRTRATFILTACAFVVADLAGAGFRGGWRAIVALQVAATVVNAVAWALDRGDRVREWHFWAVLVWDFVVLGAVAAAVAPYGYLALPIMAVSVGRYSLGHSSAGRVGFATALAAYAAGRVGSASPMLILAEVTTLGVTGAVAIAGPQAYTRRVAKVRRALDALAGGDLAVRLPAAEMDDLRPLADGFNRAAEALAAATAALERRACEDPLTGLANRAGLDRRLREAFAPGAPAAAPAADAPDADAAPPPRGLAVLAVDLDGFKAVNDTHGHAAGDRLLQEVAARLRNATRGSDLVARLGGDEFVVVLAGVVGPEDARVVADRVVSAVAAPYRAGVAAAGGVRVGASVGVAWRAAERRAAGADADAEAAALLRDADRALYQAKALGKGRYVLFGVGG